MKSQRTLELESRAQEMRANPTYFELKFAERLSEKNIRYEMQVVIEPYIVDFLLPDKNTVVELDGKSHQKQKDYDQRRDAYLTRRGFNVIRIPNKVSLHFKLSKLAHIKKCKPITLEKATKVPQPQVAKSPYTRRQRRLIQLNERLAEKQRNRAQKHLSEVLAAVAAVLLS